ncbi:MAG: hypothetical protein ACAI44_13325 [Candidatus Sericytochromatia bacterium]
MRFEFLLEPLIVPILFPFGATQERCFVELEDHKLHVKMGALFDETLDLEEVATIEKGKWPFYWGLGHRIGMHHSMGVLASTRNVVKLSFAKPAMIKALGPLYHETKDFFLALKDPDGFIREVQQQLKA